VPRNSSAPRAVPAANDVATIRASRSERISPVRSTTNRVATRPVCRRMALGRRSRRADRRSRAGCLGFGMSGTAALAVGNGISRNCFSSYSASEAGPANPRGRKMNAACQSVLSGSLPARVHRDLRPCDVLRIPDEFPGSDLAYCRSTLLPLPHRSVHEVAT
jgi:hypothetical protein